MIVIAMYSIKYYAFIIALVFGSSRSAAIKDVVSDMDTSIFLLLTTIPALTAIAAMMKRSPQAPDLLRHIWKKAALLISATLSIETVYLIYTIVTSRYSVNSIVYFIIVINLWFVIYLNTAKQIKDVLREFPEPASTLAK